METILLIEDEPVVRRVTGRMLKRRGYQVLEAQRAQDAIEIAERHAGPIHLLLTDLMLPGMDGGRLADQIRAKRPQTKALFMSGYTEEAVMQQGLLRPGTAFIEKTFTSDILNRKVRELLDQP